MGYEGSSGSGADKKFRTQLGISATVQRSKTTGERAGAANRKLREIGTESNPKSDSFRYLGSMASHIYWNETFKQVIFVNQAGATLSEVPEALAQTATKDLIGTVMETYGKRRPTLRSGF